MRENTDQNNSEYGHFLRSVRAIDFLVRCLKRSVTGCCTQKFWQHWVQLSHKRLSWKTFLSSRRFVRFLIVLLYIFESEIREKKCCDKIFLQAYYVIYKSTDYEFENIGWRSGDFQIHFSFLICWRKKRIKDNWRKEVKQLNQVFSLLHCCYCRLFGYFDRLFANRRQKR